MLSTKYLEGQVALVTGASRGLGRAIAQALAAQGASIAAVARSEDALKDTLASIRDAGGSAEAFPVDVADSDAVDAAVDKINTRFTRIDILVNNAGVTRDGLLMRMKTEDWDTVINTNLKGAFHFTRPVGRLMVKARSGRIVNISSVIGLMGNAGQANYAASKAGLIGFSKSVAREFASRGITCNVVCPGFARTPLVDKQIPEQAKALGITEEEVIKNVMLKETVDGEFTTVEDVANTVAFLAGFESNALTGQSVTVSHGWSMK